MVPLRTFNIWRTFLFHKMFFVVEKDSLDYKKEKKRWFFKEPLTEWFFYGITVKNLLSTFIFKRVAQFWNI